ncbi:unknown [Rickettsia felis URRWXCal2]|uniref:HEAT repeats family protein n=1 Tax=Rickettsia felis (strain ATCC VR-1525 / URRWXCal2) TaxID=315456 RepID=Q4UL72_RICFE|nr:unknown [Rickettsia felis URRWXCal2]
MSLIIISISEAAKSISEIVRANPSMAKEAFSVLKKLINDHNTENFIRCDIASSLAEIVAVIPSEEIIAGLKELLNNPNCYIRYVAVWSLVEIIEIKPNIAIEVFIGIKELIINSNIDNYIRCEAVMNLAGIVEVIPHLEERAYSVLKGLLLNNPYYNEDVKYAAAISLINIINVKSFDKASYKQVNRLINIIALNRTQNFDKELYIEIDAKIVLHKITHHLTQEYEKGKNPEVIEWFNRCFNELPNISETRIFLKEICQSILKSGVINELESKFILSCIKKYNFTFTVSVSKEQEIEGKIIFEDRNYEIFKTDNSARKIVSLEEFATKLLVETDDPLAEQYKTHKPLFLNKGLALKIAASDINNVSSITNENAKLSTEKYLLSYAGDNKDKFVMLLEKRSIFGEHLIYKFSEVNLKKIATIYPAEINKELRGQLFNELESQEQFNCFIKNEKLKPEEEKQIFKCPNKLKFATKIIHDAKIRLKISNFKLLDAGANKRLDAHEIKIDSHNKILKDSRTIQKAEIFREAESLAQESPLLYDYCNTFYWNIDGIIKACLIAETKMFKNNINEKEGIIKILAKSLGLITQNLLIDILTDLACSIVEVRRERKRGNEVISINDIIRNAIGMEDLDDSLKKIAINNT